MGDKNNVQLITFKVGDSVYAVDIQSVREVVETKNIAKLPRENSYIKGIMNLRGRIVTLINLSEVLGIPTSLKNRESSKYKVLISMNNNSKGTIGFIVDHVLGVLRVNKSDIEKPPLSKSGIIKGIVKSDKNLIVILDIGRLISNLGLEEGGTLEK